MTETLTFWLPQFLCPLFGVRWRQTPTPPLTSILVACWLGMVMTRCICFLWFTIWILSQADRLTSLDWTKFITYNFIKSLVAINHNESIESQRFLQGNVSTSQTHGTYTILKLSWTEQCVLSTQVPSEDTRLIWLPMGDDIWKEELFACLRPKLSEMMPRFRLSSKWVPFLWTQEMV